MNSCTGEAIAVKENGTEGREGERERDTDTDEVKMIISHSFFHKRIAAHSQNKKVLSCCHERNDSYCCRSVYPLTQSSLLPSAPSSLLSSVLYPEGKSLQDD